MSLLSVKNTLSRDKYSTGRNKMIIMEERMTNVIIVVDATNGFCKEGAIVDKGIMQNVPSMVNLVKRKRLLGYKIIVVADNHKPDDLEFQRFPKHCIIGTEETKVIDELKEFVDYYVPKTRYSGFYKTNLAKILEKEKPKEVIVIGAWTDICVMFTIADLCNRGYNVVVPRDCIKARDMTKTEMCLDIIENTLGAKLVETQEEL